jgi:hypothetical protein
MKKSLFAIAIAMMFSLSSFAQEFEEGDKVLNLGIGFGSTLYAGSLYSTSLPPVSASFEVGIKDGVLDEGSIGVGGYVGFSRYKYEYLNWGYNYTNFILGARGVFHYPFMDKLDTYGGLMLGFRVVSSKEFGDAVFGYNYSASSGGLVSSVFVGGRYYFSDNLAAMLELGYGISYINLGIALKL